jgi:uncharacterized protein YukE
MADISLSYGAIQGVAGVLNNAELEIMPQVQQLSTQVTNMLQPDGGLWMNLTSPVIQQQYVNFTGAMTNCVNALNSFANLFNGLVASLQSMDAKSAYQIDNPSSS